MWAGPGFYMGDRDANSGADDYAEYYFLTELSPQPPLVNSEVIYVLNLEFQ